ncbi:MAG: hypothetical protein AVDCRST_MAG91-3536, partial [uncultured Sphingomonadaceae bacterium]
MPPDARSGGARRAPRKQKYRPVRAPLGDAPRLRKAPPKRKYRAPAPQTQPGPYRNRERRRVTRHKRTPAYRGAVRTAFNNATPAQQGKAIRAAQRKPRTIEAREIRRLAEKRVLGDAVGRKADFARAERFKQTKTYRDARKAARPSMGLLEATFRTLYPSTAGSSRGRGVPGAASTQTAMLQNRGLALSVPARAGANIGIATAQSPGKVGKNTAKGLRDAATGIPPALVKLAVETAEGTTEGDPFRGIKNQGKAQGADWKRRYKPLIEGRDLEYRERIKKEGAAGELIDAVTAASIVGAGTGRLLGAGARSGKLGPKAKKVASEPRRRTRVTGGRSEAQRLSRNLYIAAAQKARDNRRAKVQKKQVERSSVGDRRVDAVLAEAVARGEIVPRRADAKARRRFAEEKGRDRIRMQSEQRRVVDRAQARDRRALSKPETLAFKY